jgi:spore coat protein U-like protein
MPVMLRALLLLAGLFAAGPAAAACTVTSSSAAFATSSSYAVRQSGVAATSASAGFRCSGSLITVLASNSARATMTSANGFRLSNAAGDSIAYTVSADRNGAYPFVQGGSIDYFNPTLLSLLTILDGSSFTPQIHVRLNGAANIAAGTYTDTLTVQWRWTVCHGLGIGSICILSDRGTGTAIIPVSIVVTRDCRIDAPALSFGTAALASQFAEVTQTIRADCTKDTAYSVRLTAGGNGSARPWRGMRDGRGNILRYNLYRADGTTIWDESNPLASTVNGTGSLTPATPFVYRARIDADQATPPPGVYQDTVSVLISF